MSELDYTCVNNAPSSPMLGCCMDDVEPGEVLIEARYPWFGFVNDVRLSAFDINYGLRFGRCKATCLNERYDTTRIDSADIDWRINHWVGSEFGDPGIISDVPKDPGARLRGCLLYSAYEGSEFLPAENEYADGRTTLYWRNERHQIRGTIDLEYSEPYEFASYFADLTSLLATVDLADVPYPGNNASIRYIVKGYNAQGGVVDLADAVIGGLPLHTQCLPMGWATFRAGFIERPFGANPIPMMVKSKRNWLETAHPGCLYRMTWSVAPSRKPYQHVGGYKQCNAAVNHGHLSQPIIFPPECENTSTTCENVTLQGPETYEGTTAVAVRPNCQCLP